ncbi:MAG: hypothetical protein ACI4U5_01755 [Bacilli bacterium]
MEENDGRFVFEDEKGEKKELEVYFTYHSDEFNKDFIVFFDPDDEDNLIACEYNEETHEVFDIEKDEEYDEIDKVIEAYQNDKIKFEVEE